MANHSYTHPNLTKLNQQEIIGEVLRARSVIRDVTGQQTYLFRPPGGDIDSFVTSQLRALDYNLVYWDINAGAFQHYGAGQADKIVSLVHDGSIVLLHDGPIDGTLAILPRILSELYRKGYTCVTVSELLKD